MGVWCAVCSVTTFLFAAHPTTEKMRGRCAAGYELNEPSVYIIIYICCCLLWWLESASSTPVMCGLSSLLFCLPMMLFKNHWTLNSCETITMISQEQTWEKKVKILFASSSSKSFFIFFSKHIQNSSLISCKDPFNYPFLILSRHRHHEHQFTSYPDPPMVIFLSFEVQSPHFYSTRHQKVKASVRHW